MAWPQLVWQCLWLWFWREDRLQQWSRLCTTTRAVCHSKTSFQSPPTCSFSPGSNSQQGKLGTLGAFIQCQMTLHPPRLAASHATPSGCLHTVLLSLIGGEDGLCQDILTPSVLWLLDPPYLLLCLNIFWPPLKPGCMFWQFYIILGGLSGIPDIIVCWRVWRRCFFGGPHFIRNCENPLCKISASADGGPRSPSEHAWRVRSSPHRH